VPFIALGVGLLLIGVGLVYALSNGAIQSLGSPAEERGDESIPFPSVERMPIDEAYALVEEGEAIFVDVRDSDDFARVHIAGALSIPEEEVMNRTSELPRDQLIITYCR
jgi:3-mercaptopyruvate sulfurtransferase SseA